MPLYAPALHGEEQSMDCIGETRRTPPVRLLKTIVSQHYTGLVCGGTPAPLHAYRLAKALLEAVEAAGGAWSEVLVGLFASSSDISAAVVRASVDVALRHRRFLVNVGRQSPHRQALAAAIEASGFWIDIQTILAAGPAATEVTQERRLQS